MPAKPEKPRLTAVHIVAHGVLKDGEFETPIQTTFAMTAKEYATFDLQKAMEESLKDEE